jgi:elongation factor P
MKQTERFSIAAPLTVAIPLLYLFGFGFIKDSLSITAKGDWLMASIQANDLRRGNIIIYNKDPYRILEFEHRTPGNLRAFVQVKMRNMRNGSSTATRFSSTEQLEKAQLEQHEMQYLYSDGELHHFMNNETYEQVALSEEILGDSVNYLIPNLQIEVEFLDGNPISVELPPVIELTVVETAPELKGATVSNVNKPAKLETGVTIPVPPFIQEGDRIRVNPNEGKYLERAK